MTIIKKYVTPKKQMTYYERNKEKAKKYSKEYYIKNKHKRKKYPSVKNRKELYKDYYESYKPRRNELERQKRKNPLFRLYSNIRRLINKSIKNNKNNSSMNYLGCDIKIYKIYIEKQFKKGMSWDNYGEWHIDHIKPINTFNLKDEKQFYLAFHYKNTRPLWAKDNLSRPKSGEDIKNDN